MSKKFLAGLSAVALALGMVAITAGPANAHQNTISASVACNADAATGYWKVTWTVTNSEADKTETIIESSDTALVPIGTPLEEGESLQFVEYFDAPTTKTLTLTGQWSNGREHTDFGSISRHQFSTDCIPDDTDTEIRLCHWQPLSQKWDVEYQSVASILNGKDHANSWPIHAKDIIPPFDYVQSGTEGHYDGKNWTTYNEAVWNAGCDKPKVTPIEPTWIEAQCTGEQQVGSAWYDIPAIEGVQYQRFVSGDWVDLPTGLNQIVDGSLLVIRAIPSSAVYEFPGLDPDVRFYEHLFKNFDESKDCLVPQAPTATQECVAPGEPGQASYTIPTDQGVRYKIWDGDSWEQIDAGTYDINTFPTEVKVKAVPKAGWGYSFLDSATKEWTFQFLHDDCIETIQVESVLASDQECVIDDLDTGASHYESGTITIPNTPHVTYSVDGVVKGAGEHDYAPGTYTISAVADFGYKLAGVPDPWTVTIAADEPCGDLITRGVVTPIVTFTQTTCSTSSSYTLAVEPAEEAAGVIWTVSGGLPNTLGSHTVTTAGTVTITATAAPGWGLSGDQDGVMEWSFEVAGLPDDCLPTLALTGGSIAVGGLGLGALLTVGGILLYTARKRELATPQE